MRRRWQTQKPIASGPIEYSRVCTSLSPTWVSNAGLLPGLRECGRCLQLFNSILAGIAVFVGGFAFGHWVTNSDPAFLRILAKAERYKTRYDAAKQQIPMVEVR